MYSLCAVEIFIYFSVFLSEEISFLLLFFSPTYIEMYSFQSWKKTILFVFSTLSVARNICLFLQFRLRLWNTPKKPIKWIKKGRKRRTNFSSFGPLNKSARIFFHFVIFFEFFFVSLEFLSSANTEKRFLKTMEHSGTTHRSVTNWISSKIVS